jgi:hypothetical protein
MSHRTVAGLIIALVASSGWSLAAAAPPAPVVVNLVSVIPGTPSGDDAWCVGDGQVTFTPRVVDLETQSPVTEGMVWWQLCSTSADVFPMEDCDAPGASRWQSQGGHDLSAVSPPSFSFVPSVVGAVLGVRFQYRPAPGGAFKRATSASFNLDTTCSP